MATRDYFFAFGSGNPASKTGLAPTFIKFVNSAGAATTAPSIAETPAGSGIYKSSYEPNGIIAFVMDGATTSLATSDRYIFGTLDPYDMFGATLNAIAVTLSGMGVTLAAQGVTLSSYIAAQGLAEGNQVYTKATGILDMYSRGSSTLLAEKTISDTSTQTTKT